MNKVTVFCDVISSAIDHRRLLGLNHHFHSRIVEPYALGHSPDGLVVLLAWQVSGGCETNKPHGWKLFPILEIAGLRVLPNKYAPVHEHDIPSYFDRVKTILVNFFLTVQSSYSANTEIPATFELFDTVQFYSAFGESWLIKTFAIDQDVHIWSLDTKIDNIIELAHSNTEKHYGDVLSQRFVIETNDGLQGVRSELIKNGLPSHLEVIPEGCAFWVPEGSRYSTRSKP